MDMPIYEYVCRACGSRTELLLKMGQAPGSCSECGGDLRRVYGNVAIRFTGWGFTKTDSLLSEDRQRKRDFKALSEKAEQIRES